MWYFRILIHLKILKVVQIKLKYSSFACNDFAKLFFALALTIKGSCHGVRWLIIQHTYNTHTWMADGSTRLNQVCSQNPLKSIVTSPFRQFLNKKIHYSGNRIGPVHWLTDWLQSRYGFRNMNRFALMRTSTSRVPLPCSDQWKINLQLVAKLLSHRQEIRFKRRDKK